MMNKSQNGIYSSSSDDGSGRSRGVLLTRAACFRLPWVGGMTPFPRRSEGSLYAPRLESGSVRNTSASDQILARVRNTMQVIKSLARGAKRNKHCGGGRRWNLEGILPWGGYVNTYTSPFSATQCRGYLVAGRGSGERVFQSANVS